MLPPQTGQTLGIEHKTKLCRQCDYCKRHLLLRTNLLQMQNLLCVGEAGSPFSIPAFSSGRACLISQPAENEADRGLGTSVALFCRCPLPAKAVILGCHLICTHTRAILLDCVMWCLSACLQTHPFLVPTRSWALSRQTWENTQSVFVTQSEFHVLEREGGSLWL